MATYVGPPVIGESIAAATGVQLTGPPVIGESIAASVPVFVGPPVVGESLPAVESSGLFRYLPLSAKVVRPALYLYDADGNRVVSMADGASVSPPAPKVFGYVGDSLTVGGLTNGLLPLLNGLGYDAVSTGNNGTRATAVGTNLRVDALVGRSISAAAFPFPTPGTLEVISTWRAAGFHPTWWCFALCSNDFDQGISGFKARVNAVIDAVLTEPTTRILWVGPVVRPTLAQPSLQTSIDNVMYPAFSQIVAERGQLVKVFNLQAALRGLGLNEESPVPLWTDDRHNTPAGYGYKNDLIRNWIAGQFAA